MLLWQRHLSESLLFSLCISFVFISPSCAVHGTLLCTNIGVGLVMVLKVLDVEPV